MRASTFANTTINISLHSPPQPLGVITGVTRVAAKFLEQRVERHQGSNTSTAYPTSSSPCLTRVRVA